MDLLNDIAPEIAKVLIRLLGEYIEKDDSATEVVEPKVNTHLTKVANWSKKIQFYGMLKYATYLGTIC